ncbi:MAG TPA: tRNA (adenosine(37)-N6)-threonylcarbamoyltransferase complex ATPase subunit type 1 TsaE [Acidimicrobiales bacterium]|nr:tRNA (adenosine(37)-N6)-threonylcarbamoyltransferase complex ATPase subunit type 1 TsaE [Acidimicrobiales bacterium]
MIVAATKSPDDTRELAAGVAGLAEPGDVLLLGGELGSGKTVFAQGFGRGLGVEEQVTSPTFTLVRTYEGRLTLIHADVYRLDHLQEVVDLALPELLDEGGVAVIEWGDVAAAALAPDFLEVRLEQGSGDDDRLLTLTAVGGRWQPRLPSLALTLDRWLVNGGGDFR